MNRRDFILSLCLVGGAAVIKPMGSFFGYNGDVANATPVNITNSPIPIRNATVTETIRDGRIVITNQSNHSVILNESGAMIWNKIDGKTTCCEISVCLSKDFGIDYNQALKDVDAYVCALSMQGVLDTSQKGKCRTIQRVEYKRKSA